MIYQTLTSASEEVRAVITGVVAKFAKLVAVKKFVPGVPAMLKEYILSPQTYVAGLYCK